MDRTFEVRQASMRTEAPSDSRVTNEPRSKNTSTMFNHGHHNNPTTPTKIDVTSVPTVSVGMPSVLAWAEAPEFRPRHLQQRHPSHGPSPLRKEVIPSPTTPRGPTELSPWHGLATVWKDPRFEASNLSPRRTHDLHPLVKDATVERRATLKSHGFTITELGSKDHAPLGLQLSDSLPSDLSHYLKAYERAFTKPDYRTSFTAIEYIYEHFTEAIMNRIKTSHDRTADSFLGELHRQVNIERLKQFNDWEALAEGATTKNTEKMEVSQLARLVTFTLAYKIEIGVTTREYTEELMSYIVGLIKEESGGSPGCSSEYAADRK